MATTQSYILHASSLLLAAIVIWIAAFNYNYFAWHPILMTVAYGVLMWVSILTLTQHGMLSGRVIAGMSRVDVHGWLLAGAGLLGVIGLLVAYVAKNEFGKRHFATWHGLVGLVTVGSTVVELVAGLSLRYARPLRLTSCIRLADLKFVHSLFGSTLFALSCGALLLGLVSNWFSAGAGLLPFYYSAGTVVLMAVFVASNAYSIVKMRL